MLGKAKWRLQMKFQFEGTVEFRDNEKAIAIPFNVWEVSDKIGDAPVRVCFDDVCFTCSLIHNGQGYYSIPITDEISAHVGMGNHYTISIELLGINWKAECEGSPYSSENPIRKVDSIDLVTQPWDGLCGQSCIAMIAGTSLDEMCDIMKCREWQANVYKMIMTLEYLGIAHADTLVYTMGKDVTLPKCCIILEKMGRYSHYLIGYEGKFYDPNMGILSEFDMSKVIGYLEIV